MDGPNEHEQVLTNWFFTQVRDIYSSGRYRQSWPTAEDEGSAKLMWFRDICAFNQAELVAKFTELKRLIATEERYLWPDIAVILRIDTRMGYSAPSKPERQRTCEELGIDPNDPHLDGRSPEQLHELRSRPNPGIGNGWGVKAANETKVAYMIVIGLLAPGLMGSDRSSAADRRAACDYVRKHWEVYCPEVPLTHPDNADILKVIQTYGSN